MSRQLLKRLAVSERDPLQNARCSDLAAMQQRDDEIGRLQRRHSYIPLANGCLHPCSAVVRQQGRKDRSWLLPGERPEQRQAKRVLRLPAHISSQAKRQCSGLKLRAAQPLGEEANTVLQDTANPCASVREPCPLPFWQDRPYLS